MKEMTAELRRIHALLDRVGSLPRVEEFDRLTTEIVALQERKDAKAEITDKVRKLEIMKRITQTHTDVGHALDEIVATGTVDPHTEAKIKLLWREIVTLRDIIPLADKEARRLAGHATNPGGRECKVVDEGALLAEVGKGVAYKTLTNTFKCSAATISGIVKKHGGVAGVREQYRRKLVRR